MIHPKDLPAYRWPYSPSDVSRQYVVVDGNGRYGIAHASARNGGNLWVHPIEMRPEMGAGEIPGTETLPGNAIILTGMLWSWKEELGCWTGYWCDDPVRPGLVPPEMIKKLQIVDDLGWLIPDLVAEQALAGSDQMGAWDYGAKLGKVGGERPIKGMKADEMTVRSAVEYAHEVGEQVSERGLRSACKSGNIEGARKAGRDWLITYQAMNHYLDHRPRPGRKGLDN